VTHYLAHTIPPVVTASAGPVIAESSEHYSTVKLLELISISIFRCLTRALTHSISASLVATLTQSNHCYYCKAYSLPCPKNCWRRAAIDQRGGLYYTHFFASYYSDYYVGLFALDLSKETPTDVYPHVTDEYDYIKNLPEIPMKSAHQEDQHPFEDVKDVRKAF